MDIIAFIFLGVEVILGFTLLLFIPGFLLSLVFFPKISDLQLMERLAYSTVLSIGSVLFCVLFMDLVLGIYTTQKNILIVLISFSLFLTLLWLVRRFFISYSLTKKISDQMTILRCNYISRLKSRLKDTLERIKIP
jgi:uncharacterized membrane protein